MRYDETAKIDDYDLFLSMLKKPDAIFYINHIVCLYRIHGTNTSKTKNREQRIECQHSFLNIINKHMKSDNFIHYLRPVKYKTIAKIYYLQKKYIQCIANLSLSFLLKFRS